MLLDLDTIEPRALYPLAAYGTWLGAQGRDLGPYCTALGLSMDDGIRLFVEPIKPNGATWAGSLTAWLLDQFQATAGEEGLDAEDLQTFSDVFATIVDFWDKAAMAWALSGDVTPLHQFVESVVAMVQGAGPSDFLGGWTKDVAEYLAALAWLDAMCEAAEEDA